uniref:Secreted protein n=1 Tax=Heterorhabditis bacteriophora TaxID=37862 RepID=A0A1I7WAG0_HETBA
MNPSEIILLSWTISEGAESVAEGSTGAMLCGIFPVFFSWPVLLLNQCREYWRRTICYPSTEQEHVFQQ